jgi:hypothetical protein
MIPQATLESRALLPTAWSYAIVILVLGVAGTVLFGTLHALVIVPIWRRLFGGLPFATLAAGAMTWVYASLLASSRLAAGFRGSVRYGILLWLSVLPTTLLGATLRLTGLHRQTGNLELGAELIVAAATGALAGRLWLHSTPRAIECGCLVTALVLAMAGPIPITNGPRPQLLFMGFLPVFIVGALTLSGLLRWLGLPRTQLPHY